MNTQTLVLERPIELSTRHVTEIPVGDLNILINHAFCYGNNHGYDPYDFVEAETGDGEGNFDAFNEDAPRMYTIDGVDGGIGEQRLEELANGQIGINEIRVTVYLNNLANRGLLQKGTYVVLAEKTPEVLLTFF
jgi:hypothetical protein